MKESFTECNFTFYKKEFHNIAQNIMTKTKIDVLRNYTCNPNRERSGQTSLPVNHFGPETQTQLKARLRLK